MNIIKTTPITVPHCLRIYTLPQVPSFAVVDGMAVITTTEEPTVSEQDVVPGSLEISDTPDEYGNQTKQYAFRIRGVTPQRTALLNNLRNEWCIIIYHDESGNNRVAGSRDWPLSFAFHITNGGYLCTLSGQGTQHDPFLG